MSKYDPLSERLAGRRESDWRASFSEIEDVLGFPLPKSARGGAAWWSNNGERPHVRAWTGVGWQVAEVDPAAEAVVFRRPVSAAALQNPLAPAEDIGPEVSPQPEASGDVQPVRMRRAAEVASRRMRAKSWGLTAAIAAAAAGLGALVVRGLMRRWRTPNA